MNEYNPLHAHQGGFIITNNNGLRFFKNWMLDFVFMHDYLPLPFHLTISLKWFALVVKIHVYFSLLGHATLVHTIV
jgi:hypothetical protein